MVDALEEFTDTSYFGKNYLRVPENNVYVPPRQHVMKKPDLYDDTHDEVSYQFNMHRVSPYHYLNTLKGKTSHCDASCRQQAQSLRGAPAAAIDLGAEQVLREEQEALKA